MMRAIVFDRFGGPEVLEERMVQDPVPRRREVLVRVRAAALNPKDIVVRKGKFRLLVGTSFPMPMGHDWAGDVVALGKDSGDLRVGDRLCGCFTDLRIRRGSFAEYVVSSVDACARIPSTMSYEEAASLPLAAQTALQALRDHLRVTSGSRILVHGASGGVGTLAIEIAKILGAYVITTSSARNLAFCRELGANETLDYAQDAPFSPGQGYDGIFDVFGNQSFASARASLAPRGVYVSTIPSTRILRDAAWTVLAAQRARLVLIRTRRPDLETILGWCSEGRMRPVVDRVFAWSEVRDAVRYLETKRARGKVVVRIEQSAAPIC